MKSAIWQSLATSSHSDASRVTDDVHIELRYLVTSRRCLAVVLMEKRYVFTRSNHYFLSFEAASWARGHEEIERLNMTLRVTRLNLVSDLGRIPAAQIRHREIYFVILLSTAYSQHSMPSFGAGPAVHNALVDAPTVDDPATNKYNKRRAREQLALRDLLLWLAGVHIYILLAGTCNKALLLVEHIYLCTTLDPMQPKL